MTGLIDTHAHLDELDDAGSALAAAGTAGVTTVIAVGQDLTSNRKVLELAGRYPGLVYPALGLHPWNISRTGVDETLTFIEAHIQGAVAVGEIGLDYARPARERAGKDRQKEVFAAVLALAKKYERPVCIHSRYAWQDAFDMTSAGGIERAVFHWFTGTSRALRAIIENGYYLSATPAVEYHEEHRRAVRETPLEQLLLETDTPVTYARGRTDEFEARPADAARVLRGVAQLLGLPEVELARVTTENARRLFGLPQPS